MLEYGSGENLYWDPVHDEVRFSVDQGAQKLLIRIAPDALRELCGAAPNADAYVGAARRNFSHITHRISDKLSLGLTEADGSVLIRKTDW
ncbi:MAG: hypothetical protein P8076_04340 [Gammaproteobacteria bacterium]